MSDESAGGVTMPAAAPASPQFQAMAASVLAEAASLAGTEAGPPFPFPVDWWRCLRNGPVSGRYEGEMTGPTPGRQLLELRVDIDPRYANSPVTNRVSGDLYDVYQFRLPGRPPIAWRVYRESWIVDRPTVTWARCSVRVTGAARYWKGTHPRTDLTIDIPWGTFTAAGPASVVLSPAGGTAHSFSCARRSDCFREINLEIDIASSINRVPLLPAYDTHLHGDRPANLPRRVLSIEEAYREAGIGVNIRADRTVIDDSAPEFARWSPAELHDALETNFSQIGGSWPRWELWGLMAGEFDNPLVGGVMFDAAAAFGGAGMPPERQGFAVFRSHSWFERLPAGVPADATEAEALRKWLYVWVHEAGHAFNFLHSWDKNRPDSLSWMNYDWRYDNRNGGGSFWRNFQMRFDDDELIHLRHGDRAAVIMGGDPWASGGHIEAPPGAEHLQAPPSAFATAEGTVPLELLVRSREFFEFLEPVAIEFRLRNLLDVPVVVDARLNPSYGGLLVFIRRPDGRVVQYDPVMCQLGVEMPLLLQAAGTGPEGADRYSESVFLTYGQYGFYFDQPGEYLVRAVYQGAGDLLVPSAVHRLRVGHPMSRDADRLAQDYFSYQVGMNLYLGGSASRHLGSGLDVLKTVAERFENDVAGAKAAITVARSEADSFFRLSADERTMVKAQAADPEAALARTDAALDFFRRTPANALNLEYHRLVRERAGWHDRIGDMRGARRELATLGDDLAERGVKEVVLRDIAGFASMMGANDEQTRRRGSRAGAKKRKATPRKRGS